jgi:hypothetical protein
MGEGSGKVVRGGLELEGDRSWKADINYHQVNHAFSSRKLKKLAVVIKFVSYFCEEIFYTMSELTSYAGGKQALVEIRLSLLQSFIDEAAFGIEEL